MHDLFDDPGDLGFFDIKDNEPLDEGALEQVLEEHLSAIFDEEDSDGLF